MLHSRFFSAILGPAQDELSGGILKCGVPWDQRSGRATPARALYVPNLQVLEMLKFDTEIDHASLYLWCIDKHYRTVRCAV